MQNKTIQPIGFVMNQGSIDDVPGQLKMLCSQIVVDAAFAAGLEAIEEHSHLLVLFGLDRISEIHLQEKLQSGDHCGIFACRSQFRPNQLGVTYCRLIRRDGNRLEVAGLDAADGSPVYDIKTPDTSEVDLEQMQQAILLKYPRHDIKYAIRNRLATLLWIKAGQCTGRLTAGLALGVMAALDFMLYLRETKQSVDAFHILVSELSDTADALLFVCGISWSLNRIHHDPKQIDAFYPNVDKQPVICFCSEKEHIIYALREMPPAAIRPQVWVNHAVSCYFDRVLIG